MRILFHTGSGGAGRTCVAAATARRCAFLGRRTLLLGTGALPALSSALGRDAGARPVPVAERLDAQQIDPAAEAEWRWPAVDGWLGSLLAPRGLDPALALDLASLPGIADLLTLLALAAHADSNVYDVIVLDGPPAAECLRLLALVDAARRWLGQPAAIDRTIARVTNPLIARLRRAPAPDPAAAEAMRGIARGLARAGELLAEPATTTARVVTTAERTAAAQARTLYTALCLYGLGVDLALCNRLIPNAVGDPVLAGWSASQDARVRALEQDFAPVPVLRAPLLKAEPTGPEPLDRLGQALYGDGDPARAWSPAPKPSLTIEGDGYVLALPLPLVRPEELALTQRGDDLTIRTGTVRRTLALPDVVHGLTCGSARLDHGMLRLWFARGSG